jgi:serine/threonine-protein kinase RsbW
MNTRTEESKHIELYIPNVLGFEKVAMACVASVASNLGFDNARVEDLKSAVAEACINAITHGNKMDSASRVGIFVIIETSSLEVVVRDNGRGIGEIAVPVIEEQVEGRNRDRGWGIFLMRNLVDEVKFEQMPTGGNAVKMILRRQK